MHYKPHIQFVDAHSEGDCRDYDLDSSVTPLSIHLHPPGPACAVRAIELHIGVIKLSSQSLPLQESGKGLRLLF